MTSELKPHRLAEIVPAASEADYASLLDGIREHGQREPVVLYEGLILDGRTRYRACAELDIEPVTREFGSRATDGADPLAYVIDSNRRRHMNTTEKAKAAAKLVEEWGDLRSSRNRDDSGSGSAHARAAKMLGVGSSAVHQAVAIRRDAPDLFDQLDGTRGNTVNAGYARLLRREVIQPKRRPQRAPTIPTSERAADQRQAVKLLVKANGAAMQVNADAVTVTAAIHAIKHRDDLVKLAMNVGWSVRYLAKIERELRERLQPDELRRVDSVFEQPHQRVKPGPLRVIEGDAAS